MTRMRTLHRRHGTVPLHQRYFASLRHDPGAVLQVNGGAEEVQQMANQPTGNIQPRLSPDPYRNPSHSPGNDVRSTQEDHRAEFYEHYRKDAEEYDKGFMKKQDEDLNTTLIFVRPRVVASNIRHQQVVENPI